MKLQRIHCLIVSSFIIVFLCAAFTVQAQKLTTPPIHTTSPNNGNGTPTNTICAATLPPSPIDPNDPCYKCQSFFEWNTSGGGCRVPIIGFQIRANTNFSDHGLWETYNLPVTQTYFNFRDLFPHPGDDHDLRTMPDYYAFVTISKVLENGRTVLMGAYLFHGSDDTCLGLDGRDIDDNDDCIDTGAAIEVMVIDLQEMDETTEETCLLSATISFNDLSDCIDIGNNKTPINQTHHNIAFTTAPNPFNHSIQLDFTLQEAGSTSLHIFDAKGRKITTILNNTHRPAGWNKITYEGSHLKPGIYYSLLEVNGSIQVKKIVKL